MAKTTYVLCAEFDGRAYYVDRISGILPANVYTSMPCDAKKFATKRSATAAMRRLNAGSRKHWVEQIEDAAD